jgi:hypothetical protein
VAKPNYAFAKRQRDLAKKQKKEAKLQKKLEGKTPAPGSESETATEGSSPPVEDKISQ